MANPFTKAIKKHSGKDPSEESQVALGTPQAGDMGDDHHGFLESVIGLIDAGKINTAEPHSFINDDVYDGLSDELRGKTDLAIPNICSLLDRIMDLHHREEDNNSFEMKNLIETLWQTKERIEEHSDVFIF
jgi:hypothetical protein